MSNEHYKIIVAGYDCYNQIIPCLESIWTQTYRDFDVCVVDDASTDERMAPVIDQYCAERGWKFIHREENAGALRSQHEGILAMNPQDKDVIVWVDLDDKFTGPESLARLDSYYDNDVAMTYGNYRPWPPSATCPDVTEYPRACVEFNDFRNIHKWGLRYNHLRTVRWDLYKNLSVTDDFMNNGEWFSLASDMAVMIPCLEMAGVHSKYIDEILYEYTSDNPISEWRKAATGTNVTHDAIARKPKKQPLNWRNVHNAWLERERMERAAMPPSPPEAAQGDVNIRVLIPSYNCREWIDRCLNSVANQTYKAVQVLLIDDASTDPAYEQYARNLCLLYGFEFHRNEENMKCPYNLRLGVDLMESTHLVDPEDVIFLLDGDDYLPLDALQTVANHYKADPDLWLTYGSYLPYPEGNGQTAAMPYPSQIVKEDAYRGYMHCFNHALTYKAHLWEQITDEDLQDSQGNWFPMSYDSVIMHPMLELCGPEHYRFLSEIIYCYNSENDLSEVHKEREVDLAMEVLYRPKKARYVK